MHKPVLIVEPVGGKGGMDHYDHSLCEALHKVGVRPFLLTTQPKPPGARSYEASDAYEGVFGPDPKWRRALRFLLASLKGFLSARRAGVTMAHFHFFHIGVLEYLNVLLARGLGMRVVVTAHDVGSFRAGESAWLLRRVYHLCAAVIAHGATARETLEDKLSVPSDRIFTIPIGNYDGLLPALPTKKDARQSFGYGDSEFVVLFFGQLKKVKRFDLLVRAVGQARERGVGQIRLLVAGSVADSDLREVSALIAECGIESIIQRHSRYIQNDELPRFFAAADVAVLPYDNIYQSGVVLLAMTYGVPVLTSDIAGMLEVVSHESNGLTFRAGDVDDLTAKIVDLARGRWDLPEIARQARHHVMTHHAWDKCGVATAEVYRLARAY
jgi:D-inositol-3-phosphate glycosyltransferase